MSPSRSKARKRWTRPQPDAAGPDRSFGGYYRTSDRTIGAQHLRGVPLQTVEDAATAAVRLGYRIVDAQIDRGLDMARRLRGAADRAGIGAGGEDVFDSAEKLLSRGALLALEWLESAANQPGSPLKRLLVAEYRLVAALLGLKVEVEPEGSDSTPRASTEPAAHRRSGQEDQPSVVPRRDVRVRHSAGSDRRAVTVSHWQLGPRVRPGGPPLSLRFHPTSSTPLPAGGAPLDGLLTLADSAAPLLEVATTAGHPPGRWRAAICENDGEQIGIIDIVI